MKPKLLLAVIILAACSDPFAPRDVRRYIAVTTGGDHTCAIAADSTGYCWGRNTDGELGTGGTRNESTPAKINTDEKLTEITAGDSHTCALTVNGQVLCWGWNAYYQTGIFSSGRNLRVPNRIESNVLFKHISAGAHHNCGIALDDRVYCWGYNRYGQNGNGTTQTTIPPEPVAGGLRAVAISAGGFHTCAILQGGAAYCWGRNDVGQLGIGSDAVAATVPTAVRGALGFSAIDAGATHTCGVANERAYCWGSNEFGEIGDAAPFKPGLPGPSSPASVSLLGTVSRISAGVNVSCVSETTGFTDCWGRGAEGQLGNGNTVDRAVREPVYQQPDRPFTFQVLATGGFTHTCGVSSGLIYCWGTGRLGQLGAASNVFSTLPQRVRE